MSVGEAGAAPAGRGAPRYEGGVVWRERAGAASGGSGQSRDALKNNKTYTDPFRNKVGV